jgi:hypothetical protein
MMSEVGTMPSSTISPEKGLPLMTKWSKYASTEKVDAMMACALPSAT